MAASINFNESVVRISANMKSYAVNLTKDLDDAKDLVQETVFKALSNQEKYSEGTNLKAWLHTIMRNIFINGYRRKSKHGVSPNKVEELLNEHAATYVTKNRAEGHFIMQDMRLALQHLNDDYRVPFMMYFRGYKYHEIAEILSLPLGTIKSRIFFARKELKRQLDAYSYDMN